MKLENLPKTEMKDELTGDQRTNLFNSLVLGKDCTEEIQTSRGVFTIKFPRMKDLNAIGRRKAYLLNGLPEMCFDANTLNLLENIATLDVLVLRGPSWYENAKTESNFTWEDCPVQSFIQEVVAKVAEFRVKVQDMLERNEENGNNSMAADGNIPDSGKSGLFDGLSGKS